MNQGRMALGTRLAEDIPAAVAPTLRAARGIDAALSAAASGLYRPKLFYAVAPLGDALALLLVLSFFRMLDAPWLGWLAVTLVAVNLDIGRHRRLNLRVADDVPALAGRMTVCLLILAPFVGGPLSASRTAAMGAVALGLVMFGRILSYAVIRIARKNGQIAERTVIVGQTPASIALATIVRDHPEFGMRPIGFIRDENVEATPLSASIPILGGCSELERTIREQAVSRVVIAVDNGPMPDLAKLMDICHQTRVDIYVIPRFADVGVVPEGFGRDQVLGIPLVPVRRARLQVGTPAIKRPMDVALASAVLEVAPKIAERSTYPAVSVVIPAKNEAKNLPAVLPRIPGWVHEVILVDGKSIDDTVPVARRCLPDIRVVTQLGRGKGDALRAGFAAVSGEIIVMLDADGSSDPTEIPAFVGALLGGADFAKGSRFMQGGGSTDISIVRRLGNWGFTTLVRMLFGHRFSDLCYGYNAFWARVVPQLALDRDGFEVETLMNIRALLVGLKVVEVASFESPRLSGESGLRTFSDGWRVLKIIWQERFSQRARKRLAVIPVAAPLSGPTAPSISAPEPVPEVVILCGGRGSRLGAVTELLPKPLVKVAGRPILHHIMGHYAGHGFNRFTLCLGYGGDMIRDYFLNYRIRNHDFSLHLGDGAPRVLGRPATDLDWQVTCVETGYAAQTGARIYRAQRYVEGPYFLCTYGDGLADVDIHAVIAFHRQHGRIATLTAVRAPLSGSLGAGRFGELVVEDDDRVVKFTEKPDRPSSNASGYINGGFFVFNREIINYLSDDDSCVLEHTALERLAADGELRAFKYDGFWQCMDTLEDRDNLDRLLGTRPRPSLPVEPNGGLVPVGAGA